MCVIFVFHLVYNILEGVLKWSEIYFFIDTNNYTILYDII